MILKKAAIGAAALLFAIFLSAWTAEARPFKPGSGGAGWGSLRFLLELKLSEAQQNEMLIIIDRYRDSSENLRTDSRRAAENLRAALQGDPFNEEAVRRSFREASVLREERLVSRMKMMAELKGVLTPEQRLQLEQRKARRIEEMKGRFGPPPEEKAR